MVLKLPGTVLIAWNFSEAKETEPCANVSLPIFRFIVTSTPDLAFARLCSKTACMKFFASSCVGIWAAGAIFGHSGLAASACGT